MYPILSRQFFLLQRPSKLRSGAWIAFLLPLPPPPHVPLLQPELVIFTNVLQLIIHVLT
jgi:hypothetical protein